MTNVTKPHNIQIPPQNRNNYICINYLCFSEELGHNQHLSTFSGCHQTFLGL